MRYTTLRKCLKNQYWAMLFQSRHLMECRLQKARHKHLSNRDEQVMFVFWLFAFIQCKWDWGSEMQRQRNCRSWEVRIKSTSCTIIIIEWRFMDICSSIKSKCFWGWINNMAIGISSLTAEYPISGYLQKHYHLLRQNSSTFQRWIWWVIWTVSLLSPERSLD